MSDAPSGKLKEQDLSNLDVTKLTPSSPEVISRQATINIGTIGHVAHGKSTIVKAVSGVQTVRFKNELERNITIKLDSKVDERQQSTSSDTIAVPTKLNVPVKRKHSSSSDFNSSKIKVVRCFDEKSLENVNAALCDAEKCIEKSSNQPQDATDKNYKISEKEANSNSEDSEISDNQNNIVRKKTCERNDETSDDSLPSLPISNVTNRGNKINNNNSNIDLHIDNDSEAEEREITDTAIIIIPTLVDENVDAGYKYIVANDHLKKFILNGQVMKQEDTADAYDPTEIDKIIDDEIVNDIHYYLVKWKNWSRGFNTWERFGALTKVQKMLFDYAVKKKKRTIKEINAIHLMLSRKTITELFELFKTESGLSLPLISYDDLSVLVTSVEIGAEKCRALRIKSLRHCLNIIGLGHYRAQQLYNLKQWEIGIIAVTGQNNITVENNTDFEGPPDSFVYTTKYIPRCGIIISDDPPIGCICKKNCVSSAYCCNEMSGYSPVYDLKKISIAPGCPVYECNKKCKCSSTCPNRVVQLGSSVNICIYKTNKYGWGVKANHDIQKGQFVANYVGEIITVQESEDRLISNSSRLDCMWNLDFEDPQNFKYIIDGTHYANFTHFINHSCNANLNVYAVWIDCLDPNIPQLALFASRDILAGEQLTTNYFSRCSNEVLKKSGSIRCQCNMKNCKGYYF